MIACWVHIPCPVCGADLTIPFDGEDGAPTYKVDGATLRATLTLHMSEITGCAHADLIRAGGRLPPDETHGMTLDELLHDADARLARIEGEI